MTYDPLRFRRISRFGVGTEPPLQETGEYTIPEDRFQAQVAPIDDLALQPAPSDYDETESTTITRHRWR
jgi:hypothetical protein